MATTPEERERRRLYMREYYARNREKIRFDSAKLLKEHPERQEASRRRATEYYWTNKQKILDQRKKSYEEHKILKGRPSGSKHYKWKEDERKLSYSGVHKWVYKTLGTPKICTQCGRTDLKMYHWANISGEYHRAVEDWIRLCPKCHDAMDGTSERLHRFMHENKWSK